MRYLAFLLLFAGACARRAADDSPLKVAAAADLAQAFPEIGVLFTQATGKEVVFSFGSSGLLAKQVEAGGPFDVLATANVKYVDQVIAAKKCEGRTIYGIGQLVVLAAPNSTRAVSLEELGDPRYVKVAIANPEHAPYGIAAQQALTAKGLWESVSPRLIHAENARQAFQLVESGNAEAGLIPIGLVRGATISSSRYTLVDQALHAPLQQGITACGPRAALGQKFIDVLMSEKGRAAMQKRGFVQP